MAGQCEAKTKSGNPCRAAVVVGSPYCAMHAHPGRAAELGRMGGRKNRHYVETAGTSIPKPKTPEDVTDMLAQAAVDLIAKRLDPKIASVLTSITNALLKAMEGADLQQRITRLEQEMHANIERSNQVGQSPLPCDAYD